jgi:hypothetical protein
MNKLVKNYFFNFNIFLYPTVIYTYSPRTKFKNYRAIEKMNHCKFHFFQYFYQL